jgi:hypothetical protein
MLPAEVVVAEQATAPTELLGPQGLALWDKDLQVVIVH